MLLKRYNAIMTTAATTFLWTALSSYSSCLVRRVVSFSFSSSLVVVRHNKFGGNKQSILLGGDKIKYSITTQRPINYVAAACLTSSSSSSSITHLKMSSSTSSSVDDETTSSSSDKTQQEIYSSSSSNKRIPRGDVSGLDARTVVDHLDMVLSHLRSRRASQETIQAAKEIASLNEQRVVLIKDRDKALQRRKEQSAIVGRLMREGNTKSSTAADTSNNSSLERLLEEAKSLSNAAANDASRAEEELTRIERTMEDLLLCIPNILDDIVPEGKDDTENEIVEQWGDIHTLPTELGWDETFTPRWHDDIALNITDGWLADQAVKISGARFVALGGMVARLERALSQFFLDLHTTQHGYTELSVPFIVSRSTLEGTSQLPKFEEDLFKIDPNSHTCNGEDAFLIPTAEVPITNLYRDTILDESDLPLSFTALTPCFRAEAGSYGRDTRGLVRTHQFHKVELVKITRPEDSDAEHETLTRHAQACLEALKLPYRKVRLCSGDIGFSARHCYDLEVWLPGQGVYKEISSCSNTGDFQAKRMGLRYRPSEVAAAEEGDKKKKGVPKKSKPRPCHTINGSGLAVGRALVAVLENYQKPDGSVVIPEVLRPYMGGLEMLKINV